MGNEHHSSSGHEYDIYNFIPAIILYPSLCTPAVLTENDDYVEILLLGMKEEEMNIGKINVSYQLKIDNQVQKKKRVQHVKTPIPMDRIVFDGKEDISDGIIDTKSKFTGMLDIRALKLYKDYGFTKLYKYRINIKGIFKTKAGSKRSLFNLIWVHRQFVRDLKVLKEKKKFRSLGFTERRGTANKSQEEFPIPGGMDINNIADWPIKVAEDKKKMEVKVWFEPQDFIIKNALYEMHGNKMEEHGIYSFLKVSEPSKFNFTDPIQSYHPVFYFKDLKSANIAHLADSHVCARQNLMKRSEARIIPNISSKIKEMVSVSSEHLEILLNQAGDDQDVHAVIISGDLIDYIKSLYEKELDPDKIDPDKKRKVGEIWDLLELDKDYENHYQDYVDYITIYSLFVKFYRDYEKPLFVVSGNHDCYYMPYGISPRLPDGIVPLSANKYLEWLKANEGIPADHNLTFYEALLLFGSTYGKLKKAGTLFDKSKLKWFYYVLTPFSNFGLNLPKQCLIGLAWGEGEDVIGVMKADSGGLKPDTTQGTFGHLPRANTAISDKQKIFFEEVLGKREDRKVILTSHFTFISYMNVIPIYPEKKDYEGFVMYDKSWQPSKHDFGTFHHNRETFYKQHLSANRDVHCILTGHSHRKALYTIEETGQSLVIEYPMPHLSAANHVKTKLYEFNKYDPNWNDPKIIVSDSAGPYPRYNKCGELFTWGSDKPSWTKLLFKNGAVQSIKAQSLKEINKPRFVVSLDYIDVYVDKKVISEIKSYSEDNSEEERHQQKRLSFKLTLHSHVASLAEVDSVVLYAYNEDEDEEWKELKLDYNKPFWITEDIDTFIHYHAKLDYVFMAMKFKANEKRDKKYDWIQNHYDFKSDWCFPVNIKQKVWASGIYIYEIVRDKEKAQMPEFKWYKNEFKEIY